MTATPTTPQELRNHKTISNPGTGHIFVVRPVSSRELWKAGVFPQGAPGMSAKEIAAVLKNEAPEERMARIAEMEGVLLRHGITSVQVVSEPVTDPETQVHEDDLALDRSFLLIEIIRLSGLYVEQEDAAATGGAFRAGKPARARRKSRAA